MGVVQLATICYDLLVNFSNGHAPPYHLRYRAFPVTPMSIRTPSDDDRHRRVNPIAALGWRALPILNAVIDKLLATRCGLYGADSLYALALLRC